MLQVNDHPSGGRSHLCNADRHAKYKKAKHKKIQKKVYKKIQHCHSSNDIKYQKFAKLQDQKENQFESVSLLLELLLFKQSLEKYILLVKYVYSNLRDISESSEL